MPVTRAAESMIFCNSDSDSDLRISSPTPTPLRLHTNKSYPVSKKLSQCPFSSFPF